MAHLPSGHDDSDGGRGARTIVAHLDAEYNALAEARRAERNRTCFAYVMEHLTQKQHELFALMYAGWTQERIADEFGVSQADISQRERVLMKKLFLKTLYRPRSGDT